MISKELLSEVLKTVTTVKEIEKISFDTIRYVGISIEGNEVYGQQNIYELAHKCKEWASGQGYPLMSGQRYSDGYKCFVDKIPCELSVITSYKSEEEAIFRACTWILENKDK